jgi:hypothetical protein
MDPSFYDDLASFHHLLYADWEASVQRQGAALDDVLFQPVLLGYRSGAA